MLGTIRSEEGRSTALEEAEKPNHAANSNRPADSLCNALVEVLGEWGEVKLPMRSAVHLWPTPPSRQVQFLSTKSRTCLDGK